MKVIFISIFFCLVYYILFIKPLFFRRIYNLKLDKRNKKIRIKGIRSSPIEKPPIDYSIEQADYNYYQDINQEFNLRRQLYETATEIIGPEVELTGDNAWLPHNLIYDLDNQNVHDSFVQKDTQRIYKDVQNNIITSQGDPDFSSLDPEVINIVNKIKNRNNYISNLDDTEYEILKNAWNQAEYNNNIKENLILQLKDSINEDKELYCPTGVVTRIVSALSIENPEQMPKDKGTVNTEVLAKFSKLQSENENLDKECIRELVLQDYPKETVESVNSLIDTWIEHV